MKVLKKPVYIGIGVFVAGIVITGAVGRYFMSRTNEISRNIAENQEVYAAKTEPAELPAVNPIVVQSAQAEEDVPTFLPQAPTKGRILVPYAMDTLVYSETMQDYRTHKGVDIAAEALAKVCAVESGIVAETVQDAFYGNLIRIDHENGYSSVYANLSGLDMVQVGDRVAKGVIISGVGSSALVESATESHLHFELYKDGVAQDPQSYISFS